jgi:hypothetical protein
MDYMQAIGGQFYAHQSSCSDKVPKYFSWTREDASIKVFMDDAISHGLNYSKKIGEKKIAWVCESRAIFFDYLFPKDIFETNLQKISESYDAIYISDKSYVGKFPNIYFSFAGSNLPWTEEPKIHEKSKLTSFIASPKKVTLGHQIRHALADKWKNKVDLYGGVCGSPRFGYEKRPWGDKSIALNPYMFSIVIENDKYSTYFTEKLTDCFATGTIPVYWGTPDIGNYFNEDGILILNSSFDPSSLTPELYYSKIDAVRDNFERVMGMSNADDILYQMIQKL